MGRWLGKHVTIGITLAWFAVLALSGPMVFAAEQEKPSKRGMRMEREHRLPAFLGDPVTGKRLVKEKGCLDCHAIKGSDGNVGPDLSVIEHTHTNIRMAAILWNHAPQVAKALQEKGAKWPTFKGDEMAHLVSYLHSLEVLGNAQEGKKAFEQKQCTKCHSVAGEGATIAPDLSKGHPHPPAELVGVMWNHALTMQAMMEAMNIPWPVFAEGEMADLLAYIEEAQRGKKRTMPGH